MSFNAGSSTALTARRIYIHMYTYLNNYMYIFEIQLRQQIPTSSYFSRQSVVYSPCQPSWMALRPLHPVHLLVDHNYPELMKLGSGAAHRHHLFLDIIQQMSHSVSWCPKTVNKNKQHTTKQNASSNRRKLSFAFFIFSVLLFCGISLTCHDSCAPLVLF